MTQKILRAKDLISIFERNPEAIIGFYDSNEDDFLVPSSIIEETIFKIGTEEDFEFIRSSESDEDPVNFIAKEEILIFDNVFRYVFGMAGDQTVKDKKLDSLIKNYEKALKIELKKFAEINKQPLFKDYVYIFLNESRLGESGKGFSIFEIKQIVGNATENCMNTTMNELINEGKISFTGNDEKSTTFFISELADEVLEKEIEEESEKENSADKNSEDKIFAKEISTEEKSTEENSEFKEISVDKEFPEIE